MSRALNTAALLKSSRCSGSTPFKVAETADTTLPSTASPANLVLLCRCSSGSGKLPASFLLSQLSLLLVCLFARRLLLEYFKLERCKIQMPFKEWKKKKKVKRRPSFRAEFGPQVWKTVLAGCLTEWRPKKKGL